MNRKRTTKKFWWRKKRSGAVIINNIYHPPENRDEDKEYAEKLDYWNENKDLENEIQDSLDKSLLTLSSAALGLSLVIAKDFIKISMAKNKCLLMWSMSMWAVTIASVVLSYWVGVHAARKEKTDTRKEIEQGEQLNDNLNILTISTYFFNNIGAPSFIAGIVLMIVFIGTNLGGF